jgi:hypothetical protein
MASEKKKTKKPAPTSVEKLGGALAQVGTALQGTASARAYKAIDAIKQALSEITEFDNNQSDKDSYLALLRDRLDLEDAAYKKIGPMLPTMLPAVLEALIDYRDRVQKRA